MIGTQIEQDNVMKTLNLNMMVSEIETKIFDALISLGLKTPKVLEQNHDCHFITLNKNQSNYSLQNFCRSPFNDKSALESVQIWTFILRPEHSGRRIFVEQELFYSRIYDFPLFPLN